MVSMLTLAACGGGGGSDAIDAAPGAIDGRIADGPLPDALAACEIGERCYGVCVDTSTSVLHCGGCNMACASPAQVCGGALPCSCPEGFIPDTVNVALATVNDTYLPPLTVALAPLFPEGRTDLLLVGYIAGVTPLDEPLTIPGGFEPPALAAGFDVDLGVDPPRAHGSYLATAGTVQFTSACSVGATGTATNVTFSEVSQADGSEILGGCSFTVETVSFALGAECPPPAPVDAGPT